MLYWQAVRLSAFLIFKPVMNFGTFSDNLYRRVLVSEIKRKMASRSFSLCRVGVKPTFRKMTAYAIFVSLCKAEHDRMFPGQMLDPELLERKTSDRWKSLTEREKKWFIMEEIKARKAKNLSPVKTSTPVRPPTSKSAQPGVVKSYAILNKKVGSKPSSTATANNASYNPFEKKKVPPPQGSRHINQIRASLNLQPLKPEEHMKIRAVQNKNPRPRMFAAQESKRVRDV